MVGNLKEDLSIFYRDFGIPVTILIGNKNVRCLGILDEGYAPSFSGRNNLEPVSAVENRIFILTVISANIIGIKHGDIVLIKDKKFKVIGVEPSLSDGANTDLRLTEE